MLNKKEKKENFNLEKKDSWMMTMTKVNNSILMIKIQISILKLNNIEQHQPIIYNFNNNFSQVKNK